MKLPKFNFKFGKKDSPKIPWWAWRRRREQKKEEEEAKAAPRITNDTVAEHREEVLSGARKLNSPITISRHRVVWISSIITVLVIISAFAFSALLLYRQQSTSDFAYQITKFIPFPVAKIDGSYVPYEDYLFEVRHNVFYLRNHGQEDIDIDSEAGKALVEQVKRDSLNKVKLNFMAQKIAKAEGISVSKEEVDIQVDRVRNSGGVGESEQALEVILQDFYNWNINDLRKTLKIQLLKQKLPRTLDQETVKEAEEALSKLKSGAKFNDIVKQYSDDLLTKENNGVIGSITRTNTDLPPEFIEAAFSLNEGETTELVESRFGLHIIRVNKIDGEEREVAHILLQYFDIDKYLQDRLDELEVKEYIDLPDSSTPQ